ncbi:TetR/AcrR family transcriptional regulator [Levilactobacillus bambusae]|nr:TetR/AcrR family transcriptional regulator [Levilactobacillus bambusae]
MRYKDENKIKALHQAVIDVTLNEGYQNLSVAKIAKQAGVSPATLYIYYKDKKAMLGQVYLNIKALIDAKLFANFDPKGDTEFQFKLLLMNYATALNAYPRESMVMGVFNEHPDIIPDDVFETGMNLAQPIQDFYEKGLLDHRLRAAAPEIVIAYTFEPITSVAQIRFKENQLLSKADIQVLIEMAWQACQGGR